MTNLSKFFALVMFAAGAATISSAVPSQAQAGRTAIIQPDMAAPGDCCVPATKPVVTGPTGWTVKPPNMLGSIGAVVVNPTHPLWMTIPGSQWIANTAGAGSGNQLTIAGVYVYSYDLGCLCAAPKGVSVPAALSLRVYADDEFRAKLNGNPIGQNLGGWAFRTGPPAPPPLGAPPGGTPINVTSPSSFFHACQHNILTIEVRNGSAGPTGLDVSGYVSGYFSQSAPGRPCPCSRP